MPYPACFSSAFPAVGVLGVRALGQLCYNAVVTWISLPGKQQGCGKCQAKPYLKPPHLTWELYLSSDSYPQSLRVASQWVVMSPLQPKRRWVTEG